MAKSKRVSTPTKAGGKRALDLIDAELSDLEIQEETMLREAERVGIPVARRCDASAWLALASDDELEPAKCSQTWG